MAPVRTQALPGSLRARCAPGQRLAQGRGGWLDPGRPAEAGHAGRAGNASPSPTLPVLSAPRRCGRGSTFSHLPPLALPQGPAEQPPPPTGFLSPVGLNSLAIHTVFAQQSRSMSYPSRRINNIMPSSHTLQGDCGMKGSEHPKGSRPSLHSRRKPLSPECSSVAFRISYKPTGLCLAGFEQNLRSFCRGTF